MVPGCWLGDGEVIHRNGWPVVNKFFGKFEKILGVRPVTVPPSSVELRQYEKGKREN
jgi:hypothetical protein